ncbi:MAG: hypothetical protein IT425_00960 [Pirellulales bacterium]|nr:hypothetical protein [Pirellulales bacterium]
MAVAITEEARVSLAKLQPLWHETAPNRLIEQCPEEDPALGWKAWRDHLRSRGRRSLPRIVGHKDSPLVWGWPADCQLEALQADIQSTARLVEGALREDTPTLPDAPQALRLVALAYALPQLTNKLNADTWWLLVERLHAVAEQANLHRMDWESKPLDVICNQLLAGELPLVLSYYFPEVRGLRELRDDARAAFSEALIEVTDGQGLPHAALLPILGPLLACWTRARWIGGHLRRRAWSRAAEVQYRWLVRHALRLAGAKGRFLLSETLADTKPNDWSQPLFQTALQLGGDRSDHAAAALALPSGTVAKRFKSLRNELPETSLNSDWSCLSVMANGWSQSATRLAISYAGTALRLELSTAGEQLLFGEWSFRTTTAGHAARPTGPWEQLCWESGKRYDYLELGLPLSNGLKLERQILFGREDRVFYLADIVISSPTEEAPPALQHASSLPLAAGVRWMGEAETRDGMFIGRKTQAAVLPLSLREWRADPRSGSLEVIDGQLTLSQLATGRAMCCAWFLDLNRSRSANERTWRQLTVAEALEVVPSELAVGYRAQSGNDQWLIYRSLGTPGNRSVLGHNVAGEFSAGRFLPTGKVKEWIEIEAAESE